MGIQNLSHRSLQRRVICEIKVVIRRKVKIAATLMLKHPARTLPLTQKTPATIIPNGLQVGLV